MSSPEPSTAEDAETWPSKETNSVKASQAGSGLSEDDPVLDRVAEFAREYPDLADLPLSQNHGRKLRRIVTDPEWEERYVEPDDPLENAFAVDELASRSSSTWIDALQAFLRAHQDYQGMMARFADRETGDEFDVPLVDAWGETYSKKQYARARGLQRQMSGGERPSGGTATPAWEEPATIMLSLTASSVPDGSRLPPVDHLDAIHDAWSYDGVRDSLRNTMEYHLGLDSHEWGYWLQAEPHGMGVAGDDDKDAGLNSCYTHIHVGVYFDGSGFDDLRVTARECERVIDKHVTECEYAGPGGHDYQSIEDYLLEDNGCISLNSDVGNMGSYLAAYNGEYTEELTEKPIEYLAWGSLYWSAARRRTSRSQTLNESIRADRCNQRAEYPDSGQTEAHGDHVSWDDGRGKDVVCAECGSPWLIDQDRIDSPPGRLARGLEDGLRWALHAAAPPSDPDPDRDLRSRWPSADSGGSIGESHRKAVAREKVNSYLEVHGSDVSVPSILARLDIRPDLRGFVGDLLNGDDDMAATDGFSTIDRPEFGYELKAIVDGDGNEHSPGGGGVDMVELQLPEKSIETETRLANDRAPGEMFRCSKCDFGTPESSTMASHLVGHGIDDPLVADRILRVNDYHDRNRPCMMHEDAS